MEFASLIAAHRCHYRIATQYKSMKLLRATIKKTQRLDQAVEQIFNVGKSFQLTKLCCIFSLNVHDGLTSIPCLYQAFLLLLEQSHSPSLVSLCYILALDL